MRVLMTTDAVGGVWTYALDLAAGLGAQGDHVTLAVLGPLMTRGQAEVAGRIAGLRVVETGAPLEWTASDKSALEAAATAVAKLAVIERADLVHLNSPALAAHGRFPAPVVGVAHSCLATWWEAVRGGEPPQDFRWRIEATGQGYRACDAVIAPSDAFAQATARTYGVSPTVVRNGRADASSPQGIVRDIPIVTASRLWDDGKDAATLDAAAALLDTPVLAIGPPEGPQGQQQALPHLRRPGSLSAEQVSERFARSRVFCSPALYEPFGLSVLEAAQAGCALVLSDIPAFRELWDGAAVFTPIRDPAALATALKRLCADDAGTERLGAAARRRAERYGLDAFVNGTAAVYASALARAGRVEVAA